MILGMDSQTPLECYAAGQSVEVNDNTDTISDSADHPVDTGEGLAVVYDNCSFKWFLCQVQGANYILLYQVVAHFRKLGSLAHLFKLISVTCHRMENCL